MVRAQENLRLEEDLYRLKNEIQERELRFLSLKKIEENKKGYLERQGERRKQMEEAYKRTKEYQVAIAEPGKSECTQVARCRRASRTKRWSSWLLCS